MAYGDTGVNKGAKGQFLQALPWTWGQLVGVDQRGQNKTTDLQFLIDTGATQSVIAQDTLTNYKVVFAGAVNKMTAAGSIALTSYTGATLKIKATVPAAKDLQYQGTFLASTQNEAKFASLMGQDLAKDQGAIYTINTKAGTVVIST